MRSTTLRYVALAAWMALGTAGLDLPAAEPAGTLPPASERKDLSFEKDIHPIFVKSCAGCHGEKKQADGIRLDSLASALKSNKIVPGKSAESKLVHVTARLKKPSMPPKGKGDPLTAEQVGLIRAWIDQGAR